MTRLTLRPVLLALAAAVLLGLVGRVAVHAGAELPHGDALSAAGGAFVALGAPWLAAAWAVGAASERRAVGAIAGAAALGLATVAWYSLSVAAGDAQTVVYAARVAPPWVLVALVAGGAFGLAGATWRRRGVWLPAGALGGEALLLAGQWPGRAEQAVLTLELGVALALTGWAARRRPMLVPLAIACALAMAFGEHAVRDALRGAGWGGP